MAAVEPLIPPHGGYRNLKSFQVAELVYDVTVLFCERFIDRRSRTHDQMVQAARSGVQNIAEGSQDSGTSKKMEMKLTNVARGSLEELRRDYEDYLRQRGATPWPPEHPALRRFKALRCATLAAFREWVDQEVRREPGEHGRTRTDTDGHGPGVQASVPVGVRRCSSVFSDPSVSPGAALPPAPSAAVCAANGALSLLNLCCYLLDRQLESQAGAFQREGGFTERLYRNRSQTRAPRK